LYNMTRTGSTTAPLHWRHVDHIMRHLTNWLC